MKKILLLLLVSFYFTGNTLAQDQYIFPYGSGPSKSFIKEIIKLTGKERPKICYLPTASGDSERSIIRWYELVHDLSVEPSVQRVWISSYNQKVSFEETLLGMDAIVVGGGNTLNMIAIWKAQGIDTVLKKALEKGIVLAGGSAGSLCWFENGTTDSRPKALSVVEGLGFLPFSHCPHYDSEEYRRPLYHKNIENGIFKPGYAMDNHAGIIFKNGEPFKVVSMDEKHNSYFVSLKDGKIVEEKLESVILKE
ncbi:peptidase E [Maribacter polysaccharolyticus]|uniref:Type 1 glutamine amidotransferase-like domain-containing protein n=1 Tax=Maribacter polysaccharolyticus TaxID=3020831 RepID=UPI00237FD461|nr:peptidase E [Maribacter polysaccharolyticus]MDE3743258.1 peptidase E [Maribacter polysaccharolyticus]